MPPTPARSSRPGRAPGRRPATVDVDLDLVEADDPQGVDTWHAVWGLREGSTGTEFSSAALAEVVECVLGDCRQRFAARYQLQLRWRLNPHDPDGEPAAAAAVIAAGVNLPAALA
jgi:hypothetical protein